MVPTFNDGDLPLQDARLAVQDGFLGLRRMGINANPADFFRVHKHLLLQHADIDEHLPMCRPHLDLQAAIRATLESKLKVLRLRLNYSLNPITDSSNTPESEREPGLVRLYRSGDLCRLLSDRSLVGDIRLYFHEKTRYEQRVPPHDCEASSLLHHSERDLSRL